MKKIIVITCLFTAFASPLAADAQTWDLRGNVRQWIKNYVTEPHDRGLMETRVKLELVSALGEDSAFRVKSYYVYDGLTKTGALDFQEAYIDLYQEWGDIRIGRQVVAWGKADELNPTDILNPQNLSNITEEKGIRKLGLFMVKSDFRLGEYTLTAIWKPEFDYTRLPSTPRTAFIPLPLDLPVALPDNEFKNTEAALKLSRTFGMYDVSAGFFTGWDNIFSPDFQVHPVTNYILLEQMKFYRTKMYSADFAGSINSFGFWGEFAYFRTEDGEAEDWFIKNPYFQMVIGTDYTFMNGLKINVQYFKEYITGIDDDFERGYEENNISRLGLGLPLQQAASVRLSRAFGDMEQHAIDIFTIYDIEKEGYLVQPKLTFSPETALALEFGLALYGGKSDAMFGRMGRNDEVYFKGTFSF